MYKECSQATLKAIDGRRKQLAEVRGTSENAVNQMAAGNTKDPYGDGFRPFAKDIAQAGGNLNAYIDDLRQIATQFGRHGESTLAEAFIETSDTWAENCKLITRSISHLDADSAQSMLRAASALQNAAQGLYDAVWRQVGLETSTRDFARTAVQNRRAA